MSRSILSDAKMYNILIIGVLSLRDRGSLTATPSVRHWGANTWYWTGGKRCQNIS